MPYYALDGTTGVYVLEDGTGNYLIESKQQNLSRTIKKTVNLSVTIGTSRMAITTMVRGDSLDLVYTISDASGVVDLTGGSISWKALRSGSDTAEITKTGTLTDASNGITTVTLDPADTTSLGGTYAILATFTDASTNVYTFDDGALYIQVDPE